MIIAKSFIESPASGNSFLNGSYQDPEPVPKLIESTTDFTHISPLLVGWTPSHKSGNEGPRPAIPTGKLELADIFRQHGDEYRAIHPLTKEQEKVMENIEECRTPVLGGHIYECHRDRECGWKVYRYNSCQNRHCPKCQGKERCQWLESRSEELLNVKYFHVVFTLPKSMERIAYYNRATVYKILFHAASEALLQLGRAQQILGADIGFSAVLQTWAQNMQYHPHLHCLVPGGGLSPDHKRWVRCQPGFLPKGKLSKLFRRVFLEELEDAFSKLKFVGQIEHLSTAADFSKHLAKLRKANWNVDLRPAFGGPEQVLHYLSVYTHRVAITNERLLSLENGQVTFEWKDYRHKNSHESKTMSLSAEEFIRRFLMHTLPPGLQRIRQYGFLANRRRKDSLRLCRELLGVPVRALSPTSGDDRQTLWGPVLRRCPQCGLGRVIRTDILPVRDASFGCMLRTPSLFVDQGLPTASLSNTS